MSRYLLVMGADRTNLNDRWHQLMQTRDTSVRARLQECHSRLSGAWPDWDPELVAESEDVVRGWSEAQRKVRVTGSEIDAALADPRWQAVAVTT